MVGSISSRFGANGYSSLPRWVEPVTPVQPVSTDLDVVKKPVDQQAIINEMQQGVPHRPTTSTMNLDGLAVQLIVAAQISKLQK